MNQDVQTGSSNQKNEICEKFWVYGAVPVVLTNLVWK